MKKGLLKMSFVAVLVVALVMTFGASVVFADDGNGMPAAHGVDGKTFGGLVSGLAQSEPGAVAAHVGGGGLPAAHGLSGKEFGAAVSGLAQSAPGAVAEHVRGPK
jgi:hypothetical protein